MKLALAFVVGFYAGYYKLFARRTTKELYEVKHEILMVRVPFYTILS